MLDLGIAAFGNKLYAAWKGVSPGDTSLYYSSFDGSSWAPYAQIPGVGSSWGPSLCEFNGRLYAAWKGSGADEQLWYSSFDGSSWAAQAQIPGVGSSIGPALAGFGNKLYAAWKGSGTDEQLYYSSFNGSRWAAQAQIPGVGSSIGPALRVGFGGRLYAAWKGSDADEQLYYSSFDGSRWAPWARIPGTSDPAGSLVGASLAGFGNKLYAAWKGSNPLFQQLYYSSFDGSSWAPLAQIPGPPFTLHTLVDGGAMLNVGDADLSRISREMITTGVSAESGGVLGDLPAQGRWSYQTALCLGWHTVTVDAKITANWDSPQLQQLFAAAVWAIMQAVSNKTGYENYRNFEEGGREITCTPEEFAGWGHYIPPQILINAYDNRASGQAGQVLLQYSTEDQTGESACVFMAALGNALQIFPETSPLGALIGFGTGLICGSG